MCRLWNIESAREAGAAAKHNCSNCRRIVRLNNWVAELGNITLLAKYYQFLKLSFKTHISRFSVLLLLSGKYFKRKIRKSTHSPPQWQFMSVLFIKIALHTLNAPLSTNSGLNKMRNKKKLFWSTYNWYLEYEPLWNWNFLAWELIIFLMGKGLG